MEAAGRPFHVMAKPSGPICNLECEYCFYLEKEKLYPDTTTFAMSEQTLEAFVRQYLEGQPGPVVDFAWQGGEPTLLDIDFFRKVVALQQKHLPDGKQVRNALQTNGTFLDDEWCAFLREHDFLVGISIDGPRELHDRYRVDKGGKGSFDKVLRGLGALQDHDVDYNILCCVHRGNADAPLEVYAFLKSLGAQYLQFIPIVERDGDHGSRARSNGTGERDGDRGSRAWPNGTRERDEVRASGATPNGDGDRNAEGERVTVSPRSVTGEQYGDFLITVFNRWVREDVGRVSIQVFDVCMRSYVGLNPGLCVFEETCGDGLALEHNGDLYSCDHYVDPSHLLGNIHNRPLNELAALPGQQAFGVAKKETLPRYCRECDVRERCNGGCPKNRFVAAPSGEPGLNYLCAGYRAFFRYVDPYMRIMASDYRAGRNPARIMTYLQTNPRAFAPQGIGRNDRCFCSSGKKFKNCCGRR